MNNLISEKYADIGLVVLSILLVIVLGFFIYFFLKRSLKILLAKNTVNETFYLMAKNVLKWLIFLSVFIIILQQIGIKLNSIFAVLLTLAGMVAIGFIAVWSILSNLSCALFLILFNMFQIGDEIEIMETVGGPGMKGRVHDFNVMFTSLVEDAVDGNEGFVTQIPNNIFFQKTIRRKKGSKTVNLGQHLLSKPVFQLKKPDSSPDKAAPR
ncbi:MAG: mechanosensitive ion channel family protein [Proteobacteria bacterium]|nr:mechanosensitive ion channel family protein [Pseudomonadota bacterium]MBU4296614.1 mechanosensitive ion channel family protein [Pseudomonadota bacterium]MCG2748243.1 mechanosensitive ion channel family protein [Desulfobulbaceae bacterium]